jgi:BioD-like phosphotransacetylase family protein
MALIDDFITTVTRYRTEDDQEWATLADARTHALQIISGRFIARLARALEIADQLEAEDISLEDFNAIREELAVLLRRLVRRIRTGNE